MKHAKPLQPPIPIGYAALIDQFKIKALPHYRSSFLLEHGSQYAEKEGYYETYYYPKKYFPKDIQNPLRHIEFALKYDGMNLEILEAAFAHIEPRLLQAYIQAQPTSKTARRIWYLYELLTETRLDLPDTSGGTYTLLLDPAEYYTGKIVKSKRHYINDNLLGNVHFCPFVRRTAKLKQYEEKKLEQKAKDIIKQYDAAVLARAVNYLYAKETLSSYEIEREKPDSNRAQRFIEVLKRVDHLETLTKKALIQLQNLIVDPRFKNLDYRESQVYVGSHMRLDQYMGTIDYICPKPEDVGELMQGLLVSAERMTQDEVVLCPVIRDWKKII